MQRRIPFFLLLGLILCVTSMASAQPSHVSYQGSLLKNGVTYDGSAEFKFAVICGGTQIVWSNEDLSGNPPTTSVTINVVRGVFSVLLGGEQGMPPLTADLLCDDAQLRVWVDSGQGFEQMPDQPFSSAAFALKSELSAEGGINDGDWVVMGEDMYAGVSGGIGVGTTAPDASALLDLQSQTRGFLPPRMTEAERDAIVSPADGLVIYNTTTGCLNYYAAGTWLQLCGTYPCTSVDCDDGDPCTVDTCDPASGCVHTPVDCDDGDPCTVDTCDPISGCVHTPIDCDDGDPCTVDTCDPVTGGCVHTPVDCDDGDSCTVDTCDPATGGCVHTPVDCDDGDPNTVDTCDPNQGCIHTPINEGTSNK